MVENLVRDNIKKLKPYTSARDQNLEGILLDANENSYGSVLETDLAEDLNRYPDPNQHLIRNIASEYLKVDKKNLFFGVGSDEIIDLLIRIFCEPAVDKALILKPTYGMYQVACDINNVETDAELLNDEFQIDLNNTISKVEKNTKLIFLCSPNNPTGNLISKDSIVALAKQVNAVVIVDEAYVDFSEEGSLTNDAAEIENLVVTRTFSKAWGLAGIRCGYAIADEKIIELLYNVKAPYNLSKLTQNAVVKAFKAANKKEDFIKKIVEERNRMLSELQNLKGIKKIFKTDANFILFRVEKAKEIYTKLLNQGVVIRDRSNQPKLDNCLRLTIGTPEENDKFLKEFKKLL
jgi:histidinol-phosphate aminotransferase